MGRESKTVYDGYKLSGDERERIQQLPIVVAVIDHEFVLLFFFIVRTTENDMAVDI